jgi:hypothetical protein
MDEGTKKAPIPECRIYWCFCLGWSSNFVGYEFGQKQSVKLLQNMVYNTTQHPHPHSHTLYVYFRKRGRGGGGQGQQFTRGNKNTKMTDCIFSL